MLVSALASFLGCSSPTIVFDANRSITHCRHPSLSVDQSRSLQHSLIYGAIDGSFLATAIMPDTPTKTAQSPFDDLNADSVLHTSDPVDVRVFRLILSLSSPLSNPCSPSRNPLPLVDPPLPNQHHNREGLGQQRLTGHPCTSPPRSTSPKTTTFSTPSPHLSRSQTRPPRRPTP